MGIIINFQIEKDKVFFDVPEPVFFVCCKSFIGANNCSCTDSTEQT